MSNRIKMVVNKPWINVGTGVVAGVAMLFAFVVLAIAVTLNLGVGGIQLASLDRMYSAETLLVFGLLILPAIWIALSAAVSRKFPMYLTLLVLSALSILAGIGIFIHGAYEYSKRLSFDPTTFSDEVAVSLLVLIGCTIFCLIALLMCGVCGIIYGRKYEEGYVRENPPKYKGQAYSDMGFPVAYSHSYPPQVIGRTITQGSPEWDEFYRNFYSTDISSKDRGRPKGDQYARAYTYRY